jgi:hypothetical protein
MCIVSMISDGFNKPWGTPWNTPNNPGPVLPPKDIFNNWPDNTVRQFAEIIQRLDAIDKVLGLRDCKDKEKQEFLDALDARIKAIEAKEKQVRDRSKIKRKK